MDNANSLPSEGGDNLLIPNSLFSETVTNYSQYTPDPFGDLQDSHIPFNFDENKYDNPQFLPKCESPNDSAIIESNTAENTLTSTDISDSFNYDNIPPSDNNNYIYPATNIEDYSGPNLIFPSDNNIQDDSHNFHISHGKEEYIDPSLSRKVQQSNLLKKRDRYDSLWDKDSQSNTNAITCSESPFFAMFWVFARTGRQSNYSQLVVPFPEKIGKSRRCVVCFPILQNTHNFRVEVEIHQINQHDSPMNITISDSGNCDERNTNISHNISLLSCNAVPFPQNTDYKFPDIFRTLYDELLGQSNATDASEYYHENYWTNSINNNLNQIHNTVNNNSINIDNINSSNNGHNTRNLDEGIERTLDEIPSEIPQLGGDTTFLDDLFNLIDDGPISYLENDMCSSANQIIGGQCKYYYLEFFLHPLGRGDNKRPSKKKRGKDDNTHPATTEKRKLGIKYPHFEINVKLISCITEDQIGGWKWVFSLVRKKYESEDESNKVRISYYQQYYTRSEIPRDLPAKKRKSK